MKTRILLVLWMTSLYIFANGQSIPALYITNTIFTPPATEYKMRPQILAGNPSKKINDDFLKHFPNGNAYYDQNGKLQQLYGLALMVAPGKYFADTPYRMWGEYKVMDQSINTGVNKYIKKSGSRLALSTLALMAGSIPRFIAAVKNKKIAGLKLTCQKTSFGASNKARKKVTGVTFAIPIGK